MYTDNKYKIQLLNTFQIRWDLLNFGIHINKLPTRLRKWHLTIILL